jgi:hypothetical protein
MHKYGESKMTQIMMATVWHVSHTQSGVYKISGCLIFVEQSVHSNQYVGESSIYEHMLTLLLEMSRTMVCCGISGSDIRFLPEQLTLMVMESWPTCLDEYINLCGKHVHGVFIFLQSSFTYKPTNRLHNQFWIETEGNYCITLCVLNCLF